MSAEHARTQDAIEEHAEIEWAYETQTFIGGPYDRLNRYNYNGKRIENAAQAAEMVALETYGRDPSYARVVSRRIFPWRPTETPTEETP